MNWAFKRFFALAIACSVMVGTVFVPAYANNNELSAECKVSDRAYSISGTGKSNYINAVIMPADDSISEISTQKLNGTGYISFSMKNSNGYAKSFTLSDEFTDGEYKTVLWDGQKMLELYFLVGDKDFKNTLLSEKAKQGNANEIIERYGSQYGIDTEQYKSAKESIKSDICDELKKTGVSDFSTQYRESYVKSLFKHLENAQEVYDLLEMLDTDFTNYNKLNPDAKQTLLLRLLKNLPDTPQKLKVLAEQYSSEAYQQQNTKPQGGASSGGSKGSGSGTGITAVIGTTPKPAGSPIPSKALSDISNHWAKDNILELIKLGIVSGSDDGNFYPERSITRAEFSKMFAGVIGMNQVSGTIKSFSDVSMTAWYYDYVMFLCEQGIMSGYTDNTFRPDANITRQEMAAAIYRFLDNRGVGMNDDAVFSDMSKVSDYAYTAVLRLGGAGIISGSDSKFRPLDSLTRAEAATVMLRTYKLLLDYASKDLLPDGNTDRQSLLVKSDMTRQEARGKEADELIEKLLKRPIRGVTRAGFISDVYDLSNTISIPAAEQYFSDLPISREETASIQSAVDMGIIERGDSFRPDDYITGYEALNAIVCALGYKDYANAAGGWPNGYMKVAQEAQLLYNIPSSSVTAAALDANTAKLMLLNMLQAKIMTISHSTGSIADFEVSDKTLLENTFGLYKRTGVVEQTNLNSLKKTGINKQKIIIIGGEQYFAGDDDNYMSYLGYTVDAYYNEDNEVFLMSKTEKNKTVTFPTDGTELRDNLTIVFNDENDNRSYRYKLSDNYAFLYNGALSTRTPYQVLSETKEGTVELIDNNDDNVYDIVAVKKPEYVVVSGVSKVNSFIYDKNSSDNMIDVSEQEVILYVKGRKGDIRFLDITPDETYEVYQTEDKQLIDLKLMTVMLTGTATTAKQNKITIDGTDYKTTEYFEKYYLDKLKLGKTYSFTMSTDGRIIAYSDSVNGMKMGYITYAEKKEDEGSVVIKMFTRNNEFEIFTVDERITVDGNALKPEALYNKIASGKAVHDQFVYYQTDSENKLKSIDLAQVNTGDGIDSKKQEGNSLTEYKFNTASFVYRSSGELMYPSFNLSGSTVFIIPKDLSKKDVFTVTNSSFFLDAKTYTGIKAYNLSENGSAEAVVVRAESSVPGFSSSQGSFIIEELEKVRNDNNEMSYKISGWIDKQYKSYILDDDVSILKASGEVLGLGDVIRFYAVGDVIKALICDFDANESVFARNNDTSASDMNGGYKEVMYQFGDVYSTGDGHIYIGGGKDGTDFSASALRNFSTNTANIAIINMNEKTVKTGTLDDIRTYKNFGTGDFVLIRQRNLLTMAIYIYVR